MTLGPSNPDPGLVQAVQTPAGGAHNSPTAQDWRRHQEVPWNQRGEENGDLAKFKWLPGLLTSCLLLCAHREPAAVRNELKTHQLLTQPGLSEQPHSYVILTSNKGSFVYVKQDERGSTPVLL